MSGAELLRAETMCGSPNAIRPDGTCICDWGENGRCPFSKEDRATHNKTHLLEAKQQPGTTLSADKTQSLS